MMKKTCFHKKAGALRKCLTALCLALAMLVCTVPAYAYSPSYVSETVSSSIETFWYWEIAVSGTELTVTIHDESAGDGRKTFLYADRAEKYADGRFSGGVCCLSMDISFITESQNFTLFEARDDTSSRSYGIDKFCVSKTDAGYQFYYSYGKHEKSFLSKANKKYDPADYSRIPVKDQTISVMADLVKEAKQITEGLKTDEEKLKAIHDHICTNYAYDMEAYLNNDIDEAADLAHVYKKKRGVCSGFAALTCAMLRAVGVSCINVTGYAAGIGTSGFLPDNADKLTENHEWNLVYIDGSWRILDVTWDCLNKYYGKGKTQNTSGLAPKYTYYGISADAFGSNHYSAKISAVPYKDKRQLYLAYAGLTFYKIRYGSVSRQLPVYGNDGAKVTFKKVSGANGITVSSTGKLTVKKGTKTGTYTVKVKISTGESKLYQATSKTCSLKVTVK